MITNKKGLDLIKEFEGLELLAYQDIAGVWTIGYGHTSPDVKPDDAITAKQAEELLIRDILVREKKLTGWCEHWGISPNENEYSATISFIYNLGFGSFKGSTFARRWRKGNKLGGADSMKWWNKATVDGTLRPIVGLTRRRNAEAALFLTPVSKSSNAPTKSNYTLEEDSRITNGVVIETKPKTSVTRFNLWGLIVGIITKNLRNR